MLVFYLRPYLHHVFCWFAGVWPQCPKALSTKRWTADRSWTVLQRAGYKRENDPNGSGRFLLGSGTSSVSHHPFIIFLVTITNALLLGLYLISTLERSRKLCNTRYSTLFLLFLLSLYLIFFAYFSKNSWQMSQNLGLRPSLKEIFFRRCYLC